MFWLWLSRFAERQVFREDLRSLISAARTFLSRLDYGDQGEELEKYRVELNRAIEYASVHLRDK